MLGSGDAAVGLHMLHCDNGKIKILTFMRVAEATFSDSTCAAL